MMSCLSLKREKGRIGNACEDSPLSVISDNKSSISSSGSDITSSSLLVSRKKPRTRRKRPQEIYNEAAAALSTIYPKIFYPQKCVPHPKKFEKFFSTKRKIIKPLRSAEEAELLHEVPALISRIREVEDTEVLYSQWGGRGPVLSNRESLSECPNISGNDRNRSPLPTSESNPHSDDPTPSISPSWECLLDSNDEELDGGIMSTIMGTSANPDSSEMEGNLGVFGIGANENVKESSSFSCSAIRSVRRSPDFMICPIIDYSFKVSGETEKNTMFYDTRQRLKLKLNYEDVLNAWSNRGSLYTDDELQQPQTTTTTVPPHSPFDPIATSCMNFDLVLDVGFWRSADENGIGINGQTDEDGMLTGSGVREASVLRYKEKRRSRLFSKKIRYQVRKLNAERRPRMKGRFVRRLAENSFG